MQEREGAEFRFMRDAEWPDLCATINTDALATIDAQAAAIKAQSDALAALQAEYDALLARATKAAEDARAVIANKDISAERTCEIIDASAAELLKNKAARDLDAALKVQADATAVVDRLRQL